MAAISDTAAMIAGMRPVLRPGRWVFCCATEAERARAASERALATIREAEGLSVLLSVEDAAALGFPVDLPMAQITLTVHSALDGVGLTSAVAATLTERAIPCNVVAGMHHDHIFVPEAQAGTALAALQALQAEAAR